MREAPVSVISLEEIEGNIKRAGERLARLCGAYRCGLLSGQQLRDEAALVFEEGFESFLADKRLRLRLTLRLTRRFRRRFRLRYLRLHMYVLLRHLALRRRLNFIAYAEAGVVEYELLLPVLLFKVVIRRSSEQELHYNLAQHYQEHRACESYSQISQYLSRHHLSLTSEE